MPMVRSAKKGICATLQQSCQYYWGRSPVDYTSRRGERFPSLGLSDLPMREGVNDPFPRSAFLFGKL